MVASTLYALRSALFEKFLRMTEHVHSLQVHIESLLSEIPLHRDRV
jgi:hypothetical protein